MFWACISICILPSLFFSVCLRSAHVFLILIPTCLPGLFRELYLYWWCYLTVMMIMGKEVDLFKHLTPTYIMSLRSSGKWNHWAKLGGGVNSLEGRAFYSTLLILCVILCANLIMTALQRVHIVTIVTNWWVNHKCRWSCARLAREWNIPLTNRPSDIFNIDMGYAVTHNNKTFRKHGIVKNIKD